MKRANISPDQSIQENIETYCFEVGSQYEEHSIKAAKHFLSYIGKLPVVDLGCGDGAATKVFVENGNYTVAVDVNPEKLVRVEKADTVLEDFITYLSKPVDNLFLHHCLEHFVNPEEVLQLISKNLKKGCYVYIAVPKDDTPHSVHHVAFESLDELYPPNLEIVEAIESDEPTWKQYIVIARKP